MEQRPLRLGDIVDDYCPRERRITNHAVVALVDQTIRQTRCGTCDAEHQYKGAREPRRRRKDGSALYDQVLADVTSGAPQPRVVPPVDDSETAALAAASPATAPAADEDVRADENGGGEVWTTHRPLIRASLPRTADDPPPPRTIPEFTMHQRQNSRFGFRHGGGFGGNGQSRGGSNSFSNGHPHGDNRGGGHGANGRPGRHGGGRPKRAR